MVAATMGVLIQDLPRGHLAAPWVPFFLAFSAIVTLGCIAGMWKMEKWSVFAYACWATLGTVVEIAARGAFSSTPLIVRVVVVAVSFYFICGRNAKHVESGSREDCPPGPHTT
jgi:hypothetical protein